MSDLGLSTKIEPSQLKIFTKNYYESYLPTLYETILILSSRSSSRTSRLPLRTLSNVSLNNGSDVYVHVRKSEFNFFVIWSLSVPMIFSGSFPSVFSSRYFKYAVKWWFSGLLSSALLTDFTADDNSPRWICILARRRWAIGKFGCDSSARSAVFKAICSRSSSFWSLIASSSSMRHLSTSFQKRFGPKTDKKGSNLTHWSLLS